MIISYFLHGQHSVFLPHAPPPLALSSVPLEAVDSPSQAVHVAPLGGRQVGPVAASRRQHGLAVPGQQQPYNSVQRHACETLIARGEFRRQILRSYSRERAGQGDNCADQQTYQHVFARRCFALHDIEYLPQVYTQQLTLAGKKSGSVLYDLIPSYIIVFFCDDHCFVSQWFVAQLYRETLFIIWSYKHLW